MVAMYAPVLSATRKDYLKMHKKVIATCAALLAFAAPIAFPGAASAAELFSGSTPVPVGTQVVGTNVNPTQFETSSGSLECSSSTMSAEVKQNGPKWINLQVAQLTFSGQGPGGACTSAIFGNFTVAWDLPACLSASNSSGTLTSFTLKSGTCGATSTYTGMAINTGATGSCHYYGALSLISPLGTEPLRLSAEGSRLEKDTGGLGCPNPIEAVLKYELKTASGAGLQVR